jgi:uncharacterized protein (DUF302 family)
MEHPVYGLTVELPDLDYEAARARTVDALKAEGFGVLTEIDVKDTLKKKIGADFRRYTILGACNPPFAHRALSALPWVGLFLPCNVIVFERDGGGSVVSAANPREMFSLIQDPPPALQEVAVEVDARIRRAIEALRPA